MLKLVAQEEEVLFKMIKHEPRSFILKRGAFIYGEATLELFETSTEIFEYPRKPSILFGYDRSRKGNLIPLTLRKLPGVKLLELQFFSSWSQAKYNDAYSHCCERLYHCYWVNLISRSQLHQLIFHYQGQIPGEIISSSIRNSRTNLVEWRPLRHSESSFMVHPSTCRMFAHYFINTALYKHQIVAKSFNKKAVTLGKITRCTAQTKEAHKTEDCIYLFCGNMGRSLIDVIWQPHETNQGKFVTLSRSAVL